MEAPQTSTWLEVAASGDVPEGQARSFAAGRGRVAVARVDGQLYAVQDLCTHDNAPLGDGGLDDFAIQCPRHGAKFDVRTGEVLQMPAVLPIQTFPVREKDGKVSVALPESALANSDDDW